MWPVSSNGNGILAARLSGPETMGNETIMGQIHPLRALAERHQLTPRLIIAAINATGSARYEHRARVLGTRRGTDT